MYKARGSSGGNGIGRALQHPAAGDVEYLASDVVGGCRKRKILLRR